MIRQRLRSHKKGHLRSEVLIGESVNDGIDAGVQVGNTIRDDQNGDADLVQVDLDDVLQEEHGLQRAPAEHERGHHGHDHERDALLALAHLFALGGAQLQHDEAVDDEYGDEGQHVAAHEEHRVVGLHAELGALHLGLVGRVRRQDDVVLEYAHGAVLVADLVAVLLPQQQVRYVCDQNEQPEEGDRIGGVLLVADARAADVYGHVAVQRHEHQQQDDHVGCHVRRVLVDAAEHVTKVPHT